MPELVSRVKCNDAWIYGTLPKLRIMDRIEAKQSGEILFEIVSRNWRKTSWKQSCYFGLSKAIYQEVLSIVRVWLDLWSVKRTWTTVSATIFLYLTLTIILTEKKHIWLSPLYSTVHLVLHLKSLHLILELYFFFSKIQVVVWS